jgi:hypothetical protein
MKKLVWQRYIYIFSDGLWGKMLYCPKKKGLTLSNSKKKKNNIHFQKTIKKISLTKRTYTCNENFDLFNVD